MSLNAAFFPRGPLYLLTTQALNCAVTDGSGQASSYRVKNISNGRAYFTYAGIGTGLASVGAPTAGSPSAATVGMEAGATEVFNGIGPWFISSVANAFEILPGEGE